MKMLIHNHTNLTEYEFLKLSLRSVSGCNIKIGDKLYKASLDMNKELDISEIVPEFTMSEDELQHLKIDLNKNK